MSAQKIIDGLKAALQHAKCPHDWVVEDITERAGKRRIKLSCTVCGNIENRFEEI